MTGGRARTKVRLRGPVPPCAARPRAACRRSCMQSSPSSRTLRWSPMFMPPPAPARVAVTAAALRRQLPLMPSEVTTVQVRVVVSLTGLVSTGVLALRVAVTLQGSPRVSRPTGTVKARVVPAAWRQGPGAAGDVAALGGAGTGHGCRRGREGGSNGGGCQGRGAVVGERDGVVDVAVEQAGDAGGRQGHTQVGRRGAQGNPGRVAAEWRSDGRKPSHRIEVRRETPSAGVGRQPILWGAQGPSGCLDLPRTRCQHEHGKDTGG